VTGIVKRKNYSREDRIAPGVYRIDFDRFALRVVVKWKGQRVVDETKEIRTSDRFKAIEERARWAAELKAPYTPTEVLDGDGRVIFRDAPAFPPGARLVIGIDFGIGPDLTAETTIRDGAIVSQLLRAARHEDCDCMSCRPWTY
jgi:hypothetical protein